MYDRWQDFVGHKYICWSTVLIADGREKSDHFSRNHFKFMIMSALFGHCIAQPLYCCLFQLAAPTRAKLLKNVPKIKQVSAGGSNCAVVTGG